MKCVVSSEGCVKVKDKRRVTELREVCKKQKRLKELAKYGPGLAIFDACTEERQKFRKELEPLENRIRSIQQSTLTTPPESSILALMKETRNRVFEFLKRHDPEYVAFFSRLEKQRQNLELELELEIKKATDINVKREPKLETEKTEKSSILALMKETRNRVVLEFLKICNPKQAELFETLEKQRQNLELESGESVFKMKICCIDLANIVYLLNPDSFEIRLFGEIVLDQIKEKPELHGQDLAGEIITQLTINREIKLKKGVPTNWDMKESYLRYEDIMKEEAEGKIGAILNSIAYKTNNIFEFSLLT